jgi:isopentenyl phosphate kinase
VKANPERSAEELDVHPTGTPPTVVKLGGSVLTRKRGAARLRPKLLARLAEEVAPSAPGSLALLHGAGSFGHPGALRYRLASPPAPGSKAERARGASIVSAEVRRLHGAVLRALLDAGANPWSIPPSSLALNRTGRLESFDAGPFRTALAAGLLPVSFGDVVPDSDWGFSILSADTIAIALARELGAKRVLFVSDVVGVLRSPPGTKGRPEAIPRIDADVLATLLPSRHAPDVTGGIRGKVEAMLRLADLGVDAGVISGLTHGALSRALRGELVYGSWSGPGSK